MRSGLAGFLTLVLAIPLAACERNRARVTIEPKADGSFGRTVRLWKDDTERPRAVLPPSQEAINRARAVHGAPAAPERGDLAATFRGTFRAVPPDLGTREDPNRGGYDAFRCGAGWAGVYRERRPGPTDLSARYEAAAEAIDFGAKLQVALARKHLAGESGLDALVARLEGPWRRDARDLLLLLMALPGREDGAAPQAPSLLGLPARDPLGMVYELVEERGWLRVPELLDLVQPSSHGAASEAALTYVARMLGRDVDDALRARLPFLAGKLKTKRAAKEALAAAGLTEADLERAEQAIEDVLGSLDLLREPTLEIELLLPPGAKVLDTTGIGSGEERVVFSDRLGGHFVREAFVAVFAVPDGDYQAARFGRAILGGKDLYAYARWVASLPAARAAAWEAAVAELTPGLDLADRIRAIRIMPAGAGGALDRGVELLLDALGVKR